MTVFRITAALCLAVVIGPGIVRAGDVPAPLFDEIAQIRYAVTVVEHEYGDADERAKVEALEPALKRARQLIDKYPDRAEGYVWTGIALSAQAKHKGKGLAALSTVRQAKRYLEQAIDLDPAAADGAAYNALAMLYHRVPSWPVAFGNAKKAREYFHKALEVSSNLDTNYRYGEFLVEQNEVVEGMKYLSTAAAFPDRPGHKEEALKKQEIHELMTRCQGAP